MHLLFTTVLVIGAMYFLFARRIFDFFSLAFLSATAYFLPGLVGFVGRPEGLLLRPTAIESGTYAAMTLVLVAILIGGILPQATTLPKAHSADGAITSTATTVAMAIALGGFALSVLTSGSALISPDKGVVLESLNRWHILWVFGAISGAALAVVSRQRWQLAVCMLLLVINMVVGFRSHLAIATLACLVISLARQGPQRICIRHAGALLSLAVLGVCLVLYKSVYVLVKAGRIDLIKSRLGDAGAYLLAVQNSEPFVTQGVLNEIVARDYSVGLGHFASIAYLAVPFAPELGAEPVSFNQLYQPDLFPDITTYGLANNIWAEMLASGGWPLLIVFLFLNVGILRWLSTSVSRGRLYVQALAAAAGAYWAFYIHRNDLIYEITLVRRVFLVWLVGVGASAMLVYASSQLRRADARSSLTRASETDRPSSFKLLSSWLSRLRQLTARDEG